MRYDGTWVYGGLTSALHSPKNKTQIVSCRFFEGNEEHEHYIFINVKPETVGEYTGLKDKNDKEIYEGDIVIEEIEEDERKIKHTVEFKAGAFYPVCMQPSSTFEIIGNIYEHPHLLPPSPAVKVSDTK